MGVALGLETSWLSAFFSDTMGVTVPLYSWGFRGADPADYYGAEYTTSDFVRMQLYRDLSVYVEIAARAATVCSGGAVEGYMSGEEYVAAATAAERRRLTEGAGLRRLLHGHRLRPPGAFGHGQGLGAAPHGTRRPGACALCQVRSLPS